MVGSQGEKRVEGRNRGRREMQWWWESESHDEGFGSYSEHCGDSDGRTEMP